jgi:hypothetical protein
LLAFKESGELEGLDCCDGDCLAKVDKLRRGPSLDRNPCSCVSSVLEIDVGSIVLRVERLNRSGLCLLLARYGIEKLKLLDGIEKLKLPDRNEEVKLASDGSEE